MKTQSKRGKGLINTLINKLPVELHIPGYSYCGPGTKLQQRLERGDEGINPLDQACKEHDIAYSQNKNINERHKADKILENKAWNRVKSKDAKFGEKAAAWFVTTAMKGKRKVGMGIKQNKKKTKKGGTLRKKKRIILTPKKGGFLPFLLPLLGALGAVGGGAAGIAKAVNDAKANREQLAEQQRHNLAVEQATKMGKGFYLRPYKGYGIKKTIKTTKRGKGFYLKPYKGSGTQQKKI